MAQEITWSAPEFHHYSKDVGWYWIVIIITILVAAFALWQKNFLFAIFIVLASLLIITWGNRRPRTIDFTLSERGLDIGGKKFYAMGDLLGFAIVPTLEDRELDELVLHTKGSLAVWVKVIIASQRRDAIKELLLKFLPELEYEESLAEHLGRILRF